MAACKLLAPPSIETVNRVEDEMISKKHKVTDYKFHLCFKQYLFIFISIFSSIYFQNKRKGKRPAGKVMPTCIFGSAPPWPQLGKAYCSQLKVSLQPEFY